MGAGGIGEIFMGVIGGWVDWGFGEERFVEWKIWRG